jgi:hypothetical protein
MYKLNFPLYIYFCGLDKASDGDKMFLGFIIHAQLFDA